MSPGKKVIIAPRIDFHTEAQMNDVQMEAARWTAALCYLASLPRYRAAVRGITYIIDA